MLLLCGVPIGLAGFSINDTSYTNELTSEQPLDQSLEYNSKQPVVESTSERLPDKVTTGTGSPVDHSHVDQIPGDQLQQNDPTAFISTWDTRNNQDGGSDSNQVELPLEETGSYNFNVDWGDGTSDTITSYSENEPHSYAEPGIYTISITGEIVGFNFDSNFYFSDNQKILEISQWGNLRLGNSGGYFSFCQNLVLTTTQPLDLTSTTNLQRMFLSTSIDHRGTLNTWDTSSVTDMTAMFYNAASFNQPLNSWDTSSVTNMHGMFHNTTSFNQPLNSWDTSSVTNMHGMFQDAASFDQPLDTWDTSSVIRMSSMFAGATSFNQPLDSWNTASVVNMGSMFAGATSFNQPLSNWNTGSVIEMDYMFFNAASFAKLLGDWNLNSIQTMRNFTHHFSVKQYDDILLKWSTLDIPSGVTLGMGISQYSNTTEVVDARNLLLQKGWIIYDDGVYTPPPTEPNSPALGFSTSSFFVIPLILVSITGIVRRKSVHLQ